jgi:hypothetical protein
MLSQNDFFTKAILGPVIKPQLGVPLSYEKPPIAYAYGITRLKRRDWLKDRIRAEVAEQLDLPAEFVSLHDRAAEVTKSKSNAWKAGFWLAGLTLVAGLTLLAWLRP